MEAKKETSAQESTNDSIVVGVLALQGAFIEHAKMLESLKVNALIVK
jgi:hypothetical protein